MARHYAARVLPRQTIHKKNGSTLPPKIINTIWARRHRTVYSIAFHQSLWRPGAMEPTKKLALHRHELSEHHQISGVVALHIDDPWPCDAHPFMDGTSQCQRLETVCRLRTSTHVLLPRTFFSDPCGFHCAFHE